VRLGMERGGRWGRKGVLTSGGEGRGWPDFGEGWLAVVLWRRPTMFLGYRGVPVLGGRRDGGGGTSSRQRSAPGDLG
jgi:hypothetical protein